MSISRTTVRLDDALLNHAKREAARRGATVTALIEEGLRLVLTAGKPRSKRARVTFPVSRAGGGTKPGVDINNSAALLDIMDDVR